MILTFTFGLIIGWTLCKFLTGKVYIGKRFVCDPRIDKPKWGYDKYVCLHTDTKYHYLKFGWYYIELRTPYRWREKAARERKRLQK